MADRRREIVALVEELDQLCADGERHLMSLRWSDLDLTLADQRRVTQALINVVHATMNERTPEFDDQLKRRIDRIYAVRDNQLKRLMVYRDNIRKRLRVLSQAKQVRRSFGAYARTGIGHLDALR
ncbi:MAG TPA: hypothetical protein VN603_03855 [Candidatus Acidoferrales bacterium]|nr:hypothetical protein [Candidatus Acidoferrales bacterium]